MQTQHEIQELLETFGLAPQRRFGQNFLIDQNLLAKLVELAEVDSTQTVLEVGPGTGSLTEELLARAGKVVAVEIDSGMFRLLSDRLAGKPNLVLLHRDILVGKHAMAGEVTDALAPRANLVANLPYNVATPLVAQCLVSSWQAMNERESGFGKRESGRNDEETAKTETAKQQQGKSGTDTDFPKLKSESVPAIPVHAFPETRIPIPDSRPSTLFDRLTFTVQREVADRMVASHGGAEYGPVSVIVALLGKPRFGPVVPNTAFWPKPQVTSRMVRIDFDADQARQLADMRALKAVISLAFTQRRKQIRSVVHRKNSPFEPEDFLRAIELAGIDRSVRAEEIAPQQFLAAANVLSGKLKGPDVEEDMGQ